MSVEIHLAIWLVEQTLYQSLHAFLFVFFLDNFPIYSSPDVHIFFRIISNFHFVFICSFFMRSFSSIFFFCSLHFLLSGGSVMSGDMTPAISMFSSSSILFHSITFILILLLLSLVGYLRSRHC